MKSMLMIFLPLALLISARGASQTAAQSAGETKAQPAAPAVYSQNPEANELFLKAREFYSKSDPRVAGGKLANARAAIKLYEQAVQNQGALEAGLPIGSGEVESGNRSVIQARLKRSGAWWKEENAEEMLALRTLRASGQWESYWADLRQAAA